MFWGRIGYELYIPWIFLHALNSFFNFILLIGLRSELCTSRDCKLARAGYFAILGGLLWLLAAILLWHVRGLEYMLQSDVRNGLQRKARDHNHDEEQPVSLSDEEFDEEKERVTKKKKKKAPSREVPLALPASETNVPTTPAVKGKKKKSDTSAPNSIDATSPSESLKTPSSIRGVVKSPEKGDQTVKDASSAAPKKTPKASGDKQSTGVKKKKKKNKADGTTTKPMPA